MSATPDRPDKHALYEMAVQSPDQQARFLRALHPQGHSRQALTLGEDFAGTGAIARSWAALFAGSDAVCVDHDADALARCRGAAHVISLCADVLDVDAPSDVICALNFSICELHERERLLRYLRLVRKRLRAGGVFVADLYGGADAFAEGASDVEVREDHARSAIRYVWEQREAHPLTGRVVNAMHFQLADGSWMRDAFVYDWRLWSVPELRDAMRDAGLVRSEVYDRLGDAVDDEGAVYVVPLPDDAPLDENFVVYVAARAPE